MKPNIGSAPMSVSQFPALSSIELSELPAEIAEALAWVVDFIRSCESARAGT